MGAWGVAWSGPKSNQAQPDLRSGGAQHGASPAAFRSRLEQGHLLISFDFPRSLEGLFPLWREAVCC